MLVGREGERRAIDGLLTAARVGSSGVLVLTGEPGVGKTTLLDLAETRAREMQVLRAGGIESERSVPFGGLLQLLRPVLPLLDRIPPPQSDALASALLLDERRTADPSRFAVGAATLSLLSRAAEEQPLAVLVDDAHELDRPSAEAIVFAARRFVSDAVAVLVTIRSGEPGSQAWAQLPTSVVTGLDVAAVQELLSSEAGAQVRHDHVRRLHEATGGNPLALLELGSRLDRLDLLPRETPLQISRELTRSFLGRVGDLDDGSRLALLVAAADGASAATVHRACRELGVAETGLAAAEGSGLVHIEGDAVRFRHPLVRSAVYGAAPAATRRRVHRALAAVVPRTEVDRFAWHLAESTVAPDDEAARTLAEVGEQASARGAFDIAAAAHERAAQLSTAPAAAAARLAAAGRAAWRAGATERALDLADRALGCQDDVRERASVQELRSTVQTRCGSLHEALATQLDAAAEVRPHDAAAAVRLLSDAVHVCFYLGDPRTARQTAVAISELLAGGLDARSEFVGSVAVGMAEILDGSGESGARRIRTALERAGEAEELEADQSLLPLRVSGILWLRESGAHRGAVDEAVTRLRRQVALGTLPYLLMHVARRDAAGDRWGDAESGYLESIRLAEETGQTTDLAVSRSGLAWLYARQGRFDACTELVGPTAELCERLGVTLGCVWLDFAQGDAESSQGHVEAAVVHYERLADRLAAAGLSDPDQSPAAELTEAYLRLGRTDEAAHAAEGLAELARAKGQPWSLARAARARALCAPDDDFEDSFRAALELHRQTPDPFETARTELALGERLRRVRRRVDARTPLRSALATFEALGARPWADRAARELEATGETAHRRGSSVIEELTPQERQIARLLADGSTTREAAAALFLSPKTVEYHLRHVYLKLAISSRVELAEAFGVRQGDG